MSGLFEPRGTAVVGASPKESNLGLRLLQAQARQPFGGTVVAVNPRYDEIGGVPCHASLSVVPDEIDLALIFVPAAGVSQVLREAASRGIGHAVVFSSGFAEVGAGGEALQRELVEVCASTGIRVLGPNCQGLVDLRSGLVATFTPAVLAPAGSRIAPVAYVGQSGAVGGAFFDLARERGAAPTAWVSTGNEVDVTAVEAARELIGTDGIDLLCLYLEQVPHGERWMSLLAFAAARGTELAVLRSGRSAAGQRAAASHTGALVAHDQAFLLSCADAGVALVDDVSELVDLAVTYDRRRRIGGRGVAIVTSSGGAGGLAADRLEAEGLHVPTLSASVQDALREVLPAFGAAANPVDVTADLMVRNPEDLQLVCEAAAQDVDVDVVLVVVTNLVGDMAVRITKALEHPTAVPLVVAYLTARDRIDQPLAELQERGIPVTYSIAAAARALRHLVAFQERRGIAAGVPVVTDAPQVTSGTEWGARALLDWAGIARPEGSLVLDAEQAVAAAEALGGPVVLKVQSPQILHKSEAGAVRVNVPLTDVEAAACDLLARADMLDADVEGLLVQRLAEPGVELLIGVRAGENGYPATITVGLGGTQVELYGDVQSALAPLSAGRAVELLASLKAAPLLHGFRGRPAADVGAAAHAVAALSRLASVPGLAEVEVNPLIVHETGGGATAVDLLVRTA